MKEDLNVAISLLILIKIQLTRVLLKSSCSDDFILLDPGKERFGLEITRAESPVKEQMISHILKKKRSQ